MAGYDPKRKRAHSPAAAEGPAPVDGLLTVPAAEPATLLHEATAPTVAPPEPATPRVASAPATGPPRPVAPMSPPAPGGPDPRMIALAAGLAVAAVVLWRRRRH